MKIESILEALSQDFFYASNLTSRDKYIILLNITEGMLAHKAQLIELIKDEVKLTTQDATNEFERAYETFKYAGQYTTLNLESRGEVDEKIIYERRRARGPLLAITPFSSPLSSPAHKISMGILAGTSILFKPSPLSLRTGRILAKIVRKACGNKLIYLLEENESSVLDSLISDERIGIVSFTGSYETGKNIIKKGGVKRYHMELSGGNSLVLFSPFFQRYDETLANQLINGIIAKNGQRCVSIKHIFIPQEEKRFVDKLINKLHAIKGSAQEQIGPFASHEYASKTENKINSIVHDFGNTIEPLVPLVRTGNFIFPSAYKVVEVNSKAIRNILNGDISGPVVFIHSYKNIHEYEEILKTIQGDYIRSGIQLSAYIHEESEIETITKDLLWGGILFNTLPTFRHANMSFGGFGQAGLGKEGFIETLNIYTDPQVIVLPKSYR